MDDPPEDSTPQNPADSGEYPVPREQVRLHRLVAIAGVCLVAFHLTGAIFCWVNAMLLTDVQGPLWDIHGMFMFAVVAVFPMAIYGIAVGNMLRKKGGIKAVVQMAFAPKRARKVMAFGTALFLAGWISGAIALMAGGNVEYREGRYVTTNHSRVTGDSTREAYLFTKWMIGAGGCCVAAVFCGFGTITAIAASRRGE